MIDYKRLDLIYDLTEKYSKLTNRHAYVGMKLGVHPASCEFKLTIELDKNNEDIYVYESIDELLEKLQELCAEYNIKSRFKIGEMIWFKNCDGKICSFCVHEIKERFPSSFIYFNSLGDYVTDEDNLFKCRNDLIDHDIKELEALKESN